jgi:cytoskeletal protein RodZ
MTAARSAGWDRPCRKRRVSAVDGDRPRSARLLPPTSPAPGAIAQLEEHLLCKQGVRGSSPLSSTFRFPQIRARSTTRPPDMVAAEPGVGLLPHSVGPRSLALAAVRSQKMPPPSRVATTTKTKPISRTKVLTPKVVKLCAAKRARLLHDWTDRYAREPTRYSEAPRQIATAITISHRPTAGAATWLFASAKIRIASASKTVPTAASGSEAISAVSAAVRLQVTGLF